MKFPLFPSYCIWVLLFFISQVYFENWSTESWGRWKGRAPLLTDITLCGWHGFCCFFKDCIRGPISGLTPPAWRIYHIPLSECAWTLDQSYNLLWNPEKCQGFLACVEFLMMVSVDSYSWRFYNFSLEFVNLLLSRFGVYSWKYSRSVDLLTAFSQNGIYRNPTEPHHNILFLSLATTFQS